MRIKLIVLLLFSGLFTNSVFGIKGDSTINGASVYLHSGLIYTNLNAMSKVFRAIGYPDLMNMQSGGGVGFRIYWNQYWEVNGEALFSSSGQHAKGGWSASTRGSGASISLGRTLLAKGKFSFIVYGGAEYRNLVVDMERDQPNTTTLHTFLAGNTPPIGASLQTSAINIMGGVQARIKMGERGYLGFRFALNGGNKEHWDMNNLKLYDSPLTGIQGYRTDVVFGMNF